MASSPRRIPYGGTERSRPVAGETHDLTAPGYRARMMTTTPPAPEPDVVPSSPEPDVVPTPVPAPEPGEDPGVPPAPGPDTEPAPV